MIAYIDSYEYKLFDTITIKINSSVNTNIDAKIYYENGTEADSFIISGRIGIVEYYYPNSLPEGTYKIVLTQGSNSVEIYFKVVHEKFIFETKLDLKR